MNRYNLFLIVVVVVVLICGIALGVYLIKGLKGGHSSGGPCPYIQPSCDFIVYNVTECIYYPSSRTAEITTDIVLVKDSELSISGFRYILRDQTGHSLVSDRDDISFGIFYNKTVVFNEVADLKAPLSAYIVPILSYSSECNVLCELNPDYSKVCKVVE